MSQKLGDTDGPMDRWTNFDASRHTPIFWTTQSLPCSLPWLSGTTSWQWNVPICSDGLPRRDIPIEQYSNYQFLDDVATTKSQFIVVYPTQSWIIGNILIYLVVKPLSIMIFPTRTPHWHCGCHAVDAIWLRQYRRIGCRGLRSVDFRGWTPPFSKDRYETLGGFFWHTWCYLKSGGFFTSRQVCWGYHLCIQSLLGSSAPNIFHHISPYFTIFHPFKFGVLWPVRPALRAQARVEGSMTHQKQVQQERHDQMLLSPKLWELRRTAKRHLTTGHTSWNLLMPKRFCKGF